MKTAHALTATRTYRRLMGWRWPLIGDTDRLYLADDHLLAVVDRFFTEEYLRYYFRDIQAFAVRRTPPGTVLNLLLGLTVGALALAAPLTSGWGFIPLAAATLILGSLLTANAALGPTCALRIRTLVSNRVVRCVSRLRAAERLIDAVAQGIASAQDRPAAGTAPGPAIEAQVPAEAGVRRRGRGRTAYLVAMLLVLALGGLNALRAGPYAVGEAAKSCLVAVYPAALVMAIIALARLSQADLPGLRSRPARAAVGHLRGTLAYLGALLVGGFVLASIRAWRYTGHGYGLRDLLPVFEDAWRWWAAMVGFPLILGLGGLALWWWSRRPARG